MGTLDSAGLVAFSMLCGYVLTDVMSPLKPMLENELGWTSSEYGIFTSGYGWFNVFLLMLIFGGIILDRMGVRFTGIGSCLVMVVGCAIKYAAISGYIGNMTTRLPACTRWCSMLLWAMPSLAWAVRQPVSRFPRSL